jgi:hypothetical protein
MVDGVAVVAHDRQLESVDAGEQLVVDGRCGAALGVPAVQMWQLDEQDRGLQRVEARVDPERVVVVLARGTVCGELAGLGRKLVVVVG